ncbi:MAG: RNA polymerase sigma factor [Acidobacteria bacterium]|nr:MAG: RNA polymerase sigma factor [Acidobacteriota bacterium]REK00580.1 MAG: RNA polymerase sigma factor [Acidobacteriota bacterium]
MTATLDDGQTAAHPPVDSSREDEGDLVARAARGDVAAFEELHRAHVDRVYGLCLRLVADRAEAEDLTQRVFVRAWEHLPRFRGDSRLSTWLRTIARNLAISQHRPVWRRALRTAGLDPAGDDPAIRATTPRESDARIDLERAVRTLPAGARQVLVLHDVEGLTHAEISSRLGVTRGTTKAQLSRARRLLKERLR